MTWHAPKSALIERCPMALRLAGIRVVIMTAVLMLVAACGSTNGETTEQDYESDMGSPTISDMGSPTIPDESFDEPLPDDHEESEIEEAWETISFTVSDDEAQQPFTADVVIRGTTCPAEQTGVSEWTVEISGECLTGTTTITRAPFPVHLADIYGLFPPFFEISENAIDNDNPIFAARWWEPQAEYRQVEEGESVPLSLVGELGRTRRLISTDGPPQLGIGVWEREERTVEVTCDGPCWRLSDSETEIHFTRLGFIFLSGETLNFQQADIVVCELDTRRTCT